MVSVATCCCGDAAEEFENDSKWNRSAEPLAMNWLSRLDAFAPTLPQDSGEPVLTAGCGARVSARLIRPANWEESKREVW